MKKRVDISFGVFFLCVCGILYFYSFYSCKKRKGSGDEEAKQAKKLCTGDISEN